MFIRKRKSKIPKYAALPQYILPFENPKTPRRIHFRNKVSKSDTVANLLVIIYELARDKWDNERFMGSWITGFRHLSPGRLREGRVSPGGGINISIESWNQIKATNDLFIVNKRHIYELKIVNLTRITR